MSDRDDQALVVRPKERPGESWPADIALLSWCLTLVHDLRFHWDGPVADAPFSVTGFIGTDFVAQRGATAREALRRFALVLRERVRVKTGGLKP